jgi:molybdate transport system substrate-binding protein
MEYHYNHCMLGRSKKPLSALLVFSFLSILPQSYASQKNTLTVFAASSLADSLSNLGKAFEKKHSGTAVIFSFLASPTLARQINAGAPADVFVSASNKDMQSTSVRVLNYENFVFNRIVLAVPVKNPFKIERIKDLNKPGLKWIQCAHELPCGSAADAALASDGRVISKPVSLEPKASGVIAKLMQGEVDAALVYHTDVVKNRKALTEIVFSDRHASRTNYAIAIISDGKQKALARTFVDFVKSAQAVSYLRRSGFGVVS